MEKSWRKVGEKLEKRLEKSWRKVGEKVGGKVGEKLEKSWKKVWTFFLDGLRDKNATKMWQIYIPGGVLFLPQKK